MTHIHIMVSPEANRNLYWRFNTRRYSSVHGFCFFQLLLAVGKGLRVCVARVLTRHVVPRVCIMSLTMYTHCERLSQEGWDICIIKHVKLLWKVPSGTPSKSYLQITACILNSHKSMCTKPSNQRGTPCMCSYRFSSIYEYKSQGKFRKCIPNLPYNTLSHPCYASVNACLHAPHTQ